MQIKDLKAKQGDVEITALVIDKAQPRTFDKFGKQGTVCNAKIKDETGTVSLTLWNEDVNKVNLGDTIKLTKGYVGEWQGELQLSAGKFGIIEVVSKGEAPVHANPQKQKELVEDSEEDLDESDDLETEEEDVF